MLGASMPELRWALFGLGALFIVGLAIWEWRRSRRRHAQNAAAVAIPTNVEPAGPDEWRRIEPRIDSLLGGTDSRLPKFAAVDEVPVIHAAEPLTVPVAHETAIDVPGAVRAVEDLPDIDLSEHSAGIEPAEIPAARRDVEIRWPPERADRVISLRVLLADGTALSGREVRLALEQAELVAGPQTIYHRVTGGGEVLASAANLLRPGDLDPLLMDEQQLRGLSLFCVLPGALPPVRMLEELVGLARAVAYRLGAVVQDDQGKELDGERLLRLRQSLPAAPGD